MSSLTEQYLEDYLSIMEDDSPITTRTTEKTERNANAEALRLTKPTERSIHRLLW